MTGGTVNLEIRLLLPPSVRDYVLVPTDDDSAYRITAAWTAAAS